MGESGVEWIEWGRETIAIAGERKRMVRMEMMRVRMAQQDQEGEVGELRVYLGTHK